LSLGVLGLGEAWETTYRPALERLGERTKLAAVYASAWNAGDGLTRSLNCQHAGSMRALMRSGLDGVIVLDPGWYGWFPVRAAIDAGCNLCSPLPQKCDPQSLATLASEAKSRGVLIVPELRLRATPATLRLRELLATEMGPISEITIGAASRTCPGGRRVLTEIIDWCQVVIGTAPETIACLGHSTGTPHEQRTVTLTFRPPKGRSEPTRVAIQLAWPHTVVNSVEERGVKLPPADVWPLEFCIACRDGEARLEDAVHLRWRCGGREREESLSTERTAASVVIDHFARRLAGGLIPVPDLMDVSRACELARLADESMHHGGSVLACRPD